MQTLALKLLHTGVQTWDLNPEPAPRGAEPPALLRAQPACIQPAANRSVTAQNAINDMRGGISVSMSWEAD